MRAKNGVSELSSSTSVIRFSVAPTESFGFITPKLPGMALITRSPDLPLEQIPPVSNAFEIHKLADGSGMLVGFAEATLKPQLTASERPKNVRLGLYSNPSIKASHIVAVSLVKLVVDRMPVRLDSKKPGSAVLLDMDLQGTANSTSSQTGLDRPLISHENPPTLDSGSTGAAACRRDLLPRWMRCCCR